MEHAFSEFIRFLITNSFPYPILMGNYTGDESARYAKILFWLRPVFWLGCFFYIFGMAALLIVYINDIDIYLLEQFTHYSVFRETTFFSFIYCALFGAGLGFPLLSVYMVRILYPLHHIQIIDHLSYRDQIDIPKLGRWMSRYFCLAATLLMLYDLSDTVLVSNQFVYTKDVLTLPSVVHYSEITVVSCDSSIAYQTPGDTTWHRNYRIHHGESKAITLPQIADLDSCAQLIAANAHLHVKFTGRTTNN